MTTTLHQKPRVWHSVGASRWDPDQLKFRFHSTFANQIATYFAKPTDLF
jgi:hypothetical protein